MEEGGGGSSRVKRARKMPKKYEMEEESTEEQNKRLRKEQKRREKEETTTKAASPADDMKSKTFVEKLNHMLGGSAGKYNGIIEWSTDGRLIVLVDVSAMFYYFDSIWRANSILLGAARRIRAYRVSSLLQTHKL